MRLLAFEKAELLNPPDEKLNQFLIVIEGSIIIYSLLQDGSMRHLSIQGPGALLGDSQLPGNELPGLKRMIQGSFASTYPDTAIPTVTMLLYFSAS